MCLLAQTAVWASPVGASVVLGGNCLSSLAHLGTCSSAPQQPGRCSRPWGDNAGRVTAIPRRGSPLFVVFVALGGCQFRVRTSLCLVLTNSGLSFTPQMGQEALGVTAHPMGQLPAVWGLPWAMSTLSGAVPGAHGPCKHQQIEFARSKSLERLHMLGKCSKAPLE